MADDFFKRAKRVDMFVIDGQNDFCASGNEPNDWPWPEGKPAMGALSVVGADQEALNVAKIIDDVDRINKIHASLDSHHENDGAHNNVWKDKAGNMANPFQIVTHEDVVNQNFVPTFSLGFFDGQVMSALDWGIKYTKALEENGRNPLCLWPKHCLIGQWGQQVYKPLNDAYSRWTKRTGGWIDWISKGQWPWTEHYSALKADVEDPTRPETQMNSSVVEDAMGADIVVWTGWAGSHCLKWTGLDGVNNFEPSPEQAAKGEKNKFITKCVFVDDASAPVVSPDPTPIRDEKGNILFENASAMFAQWRLDFLDEMANRGARIMSSKDLIRELKA